MQPKTVEERVYTEEYLKQVHCSHIAYHGSQRSLYQPAQLIRHIAKTAHKSRTRNSLLRKNAQTRSAHIRSKAKQIYKQLDSDSVFGLSNIVSSKDKLSSYRTNLNTSVTKTSPSTPDSHLSTSMLYEHRQENNRR